MTYIISDIHGCYREYRLLLHRLSFSEEDELYILGDAMDRGPEPIRVMQDIMERPNVSYILGNHDVMLLSVLQRLDVALTEENARGLTEADMLAYTELLRNGGGVTLEQYRRLSRAQQADLRDFLECAPFYETLTHEGKLYILVHAGLSNFDPERELEEYAPEELVWDSPDYSRTYFPGGRIFLVTGHTPTTLLREDGKPRILQQNGHIALDCGCVFGGSLGAYCLETGRAVYVEKGSSPE